MPWIVVLLALLVLGLVHKDAFWLNIAILSLITATAASAWNLLAGYAGQFSFGPAIFFAVGAYSLALCEGQLHSNAFVGIAVGMAVAAGLSLIVGFPVFRLRGHHFIIATIALQLMFFIVATNSRRLGSATGLAVPIKGSSLADLQFDPAHLSRYYWSAAVLYVLAAVAIATFLRTRGGYLARAVRDDEFAARGVGVRAGRWKLIVFVISSALTAAAGSLYATYALFVDPNVVVSLQQSVLIALPAVIGGLGTFWGPLLGSFLLQILSSETRVHFSGSGLALDLALYGLLVMVFTAFWSGGLVTAFARLLRVIPQGAR